MLGFMRADIFQCPVHLFIDTQAIFDQQRLIVFGTLLLVDRLGEAMHTFYLLRTGLVSHGGTMPSRFPDVAMFVIARQ